MQTHRKRVLHRIDLEEHQGELCIEDQRERRSHLANNMDLKVCGKLLTLHRRGYGVDVEALRDRLPLRGAPEKAPRWDLFGTEGCGGGNRVSWCSWIFLGYMGIYRRKK